MPVTGEEDFQRFFALVLAVAGAAAFFVLAIVTALPGPCRGCGDQDYSLSVTLGFLVLAIMCAVAALLIRRSDDS